MERFSWLRWVRSLRQPQTRTIVRSRDLRLEHLEARENPATFIWSGAGLDNFWSNPANWSGSAAPTGAPTDQLVFAPGAARLSNVNDLTNAVFGSITISGNGYNISGNAITLGDEISGSSGAVSLGAGITSATLGLDITYGSTANSTMPITIGSGSTLNYTGQLTGTADKGLAKSGTGTLVLQNANPDWDGVININQGILEVGNDEALGSTVGGTSVATTAQLRIAGNLTIAEPLTLNGPGLANDGALLAASGNSELTGPILLDSNTTLGANSGATMDLQGEIGDAGAGHNILKEGEGRVTFSGANTFRGVVTVNDGVLALANPLSLGFTDGTSSTGVVVNSTNLRSGTLLLDPGAGRSERIANENLTLNGGGFQGQGALLSNSGQNIWTGTVNIGGVSTADVVIAVNADDGFYAPSSTEALQTGFLLIGSGEPYGLDGAGLIQTPNGSRNLFKSGDGILVLTNENTYEGRTTVSAGTIEIRDSQALGLGGAADNEIQLLTLTGDGANTFTMTFGTTGVTTTVPLSIGTANTTQIRQALEALDAIGVGNVNVTRAFPFQQIFQIEFRNALGGTDLPLISTSVTGTGSAALVTSVQDGNRNGTVVNIGATLALRVDTNLHPALVDSITGTTNTLEVGESITLSGGGVSGQGALRSLAGINTMTGRVGLSGAASIGVEADPNQVATRDYFTQEYSLTIPGNLNGTATLTKTGAGHLILPTANAFFRGDVNINSGWITAGNSESLGRLPANQSQNQRPVINIVGGAALHINPTNPGESVTIQQNFAIAGQGFEHAFDSISNKGAITSLNGINYLSGNLRLSGPAGVGSVLINPEDFAAGQMYLTGALTQAPPTGGGAFDPNGDAREFARTFRIGPTGSFTIDVDVYSASDNVRIFYGPRGSGDSVLVYDSDPNYAGRNPGPANPSSNQFRVQIDIDFTATSAVVDVVSLKSQSKFGGGNFGTNWELQDLGPQTIDYGRTVTADTIELVINEGGSSERRTIWEAAVTFSGNEALGGLAKLGDQLVVIQGNGSYQGDVEIKEGVLLVQSDTALGLAPDGGQKRVIVEEGATLALGTTIAALNGGRQSGIQAQNFKLELNGTGNNTLLRPIAGDRNPIPVGQLAALEVLPNADIVNGTGSTPYTTIVASDYLWRGGIGLTANSAVRVAPGTRLNVLGSIDDADNASPSGSDLVFIGGGELGLFGASSYRGVTYVGTSASDNPVLGGSTVGINESFSSTASNTPLVGGTLTIANSQALGSNEGGTIIQNGSALQLEGNLTIAGEQLTITGSGLQSVPTAPPAIWFQQGPAAQTDGPTMGTDTATVAGRITGVAVDPTDTAGTTIIVSTAGGGSWRTTDGGTTWQPTFDNVGNAPIFTGAIAIDPRNPNNVYLGTGEANNSTDSFAGTGVWRSTDGGKTWGSAPIGGFNNPINGLSVTRIIVDPVDNNFVYVATSDRSPNASQSVNRAVGVYRANVSGNSWTNLTAVVSDLRDSGDSVAFPHSSTTAGNRPPANAGPDDDWRVYFPTQNTAYSDLAVSTEVITGGTGQRTVLWMALGSPNGEQTNSRAVGESGSTQASVIQRAANGVYLLRSPASFGEGGNNDNEGWTQARFAYSIGGGTSTATVRDRQLEGLPGFFSSTSIPNNGTIKISVSGTSLQSTRIFAVVTDSANQNYREAYTGVFSFDNATTPTYAEIDWTAVAADPTTSYMSSLGHYASAIYATGTTVYLGGSTGVFRSTDSGANWTTLTGGSTNPPANVRSIVPYTLTQGTTTRSGILVGSDGGLFFYDTTAQTWESFNGNLANALANSVGITASLPNRLFAGTQGSAFSTTNGTQEWDSVLGTSALTYGGQVRVNNGNSNIVYASLSNGPIANPGPGRIPSWQMYRSTDAGVTWTALNLLNSSPPTFSGLSGVFTLDSINPDRVLISTSIGVLESLDGLATNPTQLFGVGGTAIASATYQGAYRFDPSFPNVADAGSSAYDNGTIYTSNGSTIQVTKNRGVNWVSRGITNNNNVPLGSISGLAVDGRNRDTVLATRNAYDNEGKVFFSTDAGRTWRDITANLQADGPLAVWSIAVDSRNGNAYIGTDRGVFSAVRDSTGSYSSWTRVGSSAGGTSLANVQVRDVVLNQAANTLTIATYGRGVFTLWLNEAQTNAGAVRAVSGSSIWTGDVVLRGDTSIGADGSQEFRGVTAASLNIIGNIRDEDPLAPGNLVKIGGGTLTLSGANSYNGLTTISDGVIVANNPNALGSSLEGTIVEEGSALQLINSVNAEPLTLFGNGPLAGFNGHFTGALENLANSNTYSGPITLGSDSTIGVATATTLTITGTIGDNGNDFDLTKESTGVLALRPLDGANPTVNTYGGDTIVNQGALRVEGDGALGTSDSATFVRNGAQLQVGAPAGSSGITINGETLHLSGTGISNTGALRNTEGNNIWNGNVVLDAIPGFAPFSNPPGVTSINVVRPQDTLTINGNISQPSIASGVRKVGSGTLALGGDNSYTGTTYVDGGALRVLSEQALGTNNNNEIQRIVTTGNTNVSSDRFRLTVTNPLTGNTGTTVNINWDAQDFTVQNALEAILGAGNVLVSRTVVTTTVPSPTGVGTQTLTANVFTVRLAGALAGRNMVPMVAFIPGAETSGFPPISTPASGATAVVSTVAEGGIGTRVASGATLQLDLADGTIVGETLALNGSGMGGTGALNNISGDNTWRGGVTLETNSSVGVAADTVTISGVVAGASSAGLTKTGTGEAILTASNTYAGNTTVAQGILTTTNAQGLGAGATNEVQTVTLGGSIATTFQLRFGTGTGNTTTALPISTATATDVQNALNALATIGGVGGSVAVTKSGSTFTITFGGSLAGRDVAQLVALPGTGATASVLTTQPGGLGTTTVNSGATLQLDGSITVSEPLFLNGNGFDGLGALNSVSGNNTANGPINLSSNSAIGSETGSTLTLNTALTQTTTNTTLTKVGEGEVIMTGAANTYNGTTTVAEGTLSLNKPTTDGAILGNLIVGNGTGTAQVTLLADNQIVNTSAVTVNTDGTLNNNDRTETIGALTIPGGTVLTGGDTGINGVLTIASLNMTGGELNTGDADDQVILATGGGVTATANDAGPAMIGGDGIFNLGSTARTFNVSDDGEEGADLVIMDRVQGSAEGAITKTGTGLMRIDSDNAATLQGNVIVQAGELQVDGVVHGVRVTGGTVGGNGTVGRLIGAGPAVAPAGIINAGDLGTGDKEGLLTIIPANGTQTFNSTSTLFFDLTDRATGAGTPGGYDQIAVQGNVVLASPVFRGTVSDQIAIGDQFTIVTATGTLSVSGLPTNLFIGGNKFTWAVIGGNSLVLTAQQTNTTTTLVANPLSVVYGQGTGFTFSATLAGEPGSTGLPTGASVFFEVFAGNSAAGTLVVSETVAVNASGVAVYNPQLDANEVFGAGQYFVRASYAGTATFSPSIATTVYTVAKGNTNFQMTPNNASLVLGEELTVAVTISPRTPAGQLATSLLPSGTVSMRINGVNVATGPFTLNSDGVANVSLGALPVGTHVIDLTYNGDTNYNTVASTPASRLVVTVRKASANFSLESSLQTATFGEPVTFTATLNPVAPATAIPSGVVVFRRGSAAGVVLGTGSINSNGVATLTLSNLPVGNQTVFAVWAGDTNFVAPPAVSTSVNITKVGTSTVLSSSANPSNPGTSVALRADVTASNGSTPTGSVRFVNADTGAILGTASVNAPGRAVLNVTFQTGTYNIRAEYLGNANLSASNGTLTQVSAWSARATLTTSMNPSMPGTQVTLTATVAKAPGVPASVATPAGSIEFYNDSVSTTTPAFTAVLNPSGQAVWSTNALPNGANNIRAVFVPSNATYATTSATLTQNVVFNSTTSVVATTSPIVSGQGNTYTATVAGNQGVPTGTVEFRVGNVVLGQATLNASGVAELTSAALVATGANPIAVTAVYLGDNTYATSQASVNVTVNRADTTVGLTSNGPSTGAGLAATFTATLGAVAPGSGVPTGSVTFIATPVGAGTVRTATVQVNAAGQAVWSVTNLAQGSYTVTASYSGNPSFNASANNVGIGHTVLAAATVGLTTSANPALPTADIVLTTRVTGTAANGRPSGSVIFTIDGVDQAPVTLVPGATALQAVATLTLPAGTLPLGTTPITARYSGDAVYGGRTSATVNQAVKGNTSVAVTSSDPSAPVRTPVTLTATISQIAAPVGSAAPTGTVTFRNGTTVIGTATVSTVAGVTTASLTTNTLPVGTRSITATYSGDTNNNTSVSPAFLQTIIPVVSTITAVPSSSIVVINSGISLRVTAFGPNGQVATSFNGTGTLTVVSVPTGGVVGGARSTTFSGGVGTFTGVTFSRIGTYTLRVTVDGVLRNVVINVTGGGRA